MDRETRYCVNVSAFPTFNVPEFLLFSSKLCFQTHSDNTLYVLPSFLEDITVYEIIFTPVITQVFAFVFVAKENFHFDT
jgi:hypothetical protein